MSEEGPVTECDECGEPVPLFVAACPTCGAAHPGSCEAPCDACGTRVDHRAASCPDCGATLSEWHVVVDLVLDSGFHVDVPVGEDVPRPEAAGFERGRGKPVGQRADYRRPLSDGTEIHVREFDDGYRVHRDRRSASDRVGHLTRDAPLETAAGALAVCLLAGAARRLPVPARRRPAFLSARTARWLPAVAARLAPVPSLDGLLRPSLDRLR